MHDDQGTLRALRMSSASHDHDDVFATIAELTQRATSPRLHNGVVESYEEAAERLARDYPSTKLADLAPRVNRTWSERSLYWNISSPCTAPATPGSSRLASPVVSELHYDLKDQEAAHASRQAAYQFGREAGYDGVVTW